MSTNIVYMKFAFAEHSFRTRALFSHLMFSDTSESVGFEPSSIYTGNGDFFSPVVYLFSIHHSISIAVEKKRVNV